jgi:hypothetical protein
LKAAIASSSTDPVLQALKTNTDLKVWADYYSTRSSGDFAKDFGEAWTRLMNADRFDGPVRRSACAEEKKWWQTLFGLNVFMSINVLQ